MESESRGPCAACGARLGPRSAWCGRCHAPVPPPVEPRTFVRPDTFVGPPLPREFSRWRKSDVSFGPFGRVMATILLCAVPLWWSLTYSFVMFVMWVFVVTPVLLRSIWKRAVVVGIDPRTTVEGPPKPGTGA